LCTPTTATVTPCVVGTTTLAQAALPVGTCESTLAGLRSSVRGSLVSVYVCNGADCNADDSLLLLQPPSSGVAATFVVTASLDLYGYTAATFGAQQIAQFADVMRRRLNVDAVDVIGTARRRRALLVDATALSSFVHVTFRVLTASPETLAVAIVALVNSDSFVAALMAGGLTSASSVVMRDAPSTQQQVSSSSSAAAAPRPTAAAAAALLACSVLATLV
jgi:hypothetical protein